MHKVIVERPRMPRGAPRNRKTALRLNINGSALAAADGDDYDSGPRRASSARHDKHLNENLAPLRRYLESQVGRPWDKVYSEIRGGIPNNTVGLHVLQHVEQFVAVDAFLEDGVVCDRDYWGIRPVDGMYVHPVTKLLRKTKTRPTRTTWRSPQADEQEPDFVVIDSTHAYEKIGGLWFHTEFHFNNPNQLIRRSDGVLIRAGSLRDFVPFQPVSKQQCDRKTIRKIEAGEFGPLLSKRYWTRTFGWLKR